MTIKRNDPIRQAFAGCSTGSPTGDWRGRIDTYLTKGHAVRAFDAVLEDYDLCLQWGEVANFNCDKGRAAIGVCGEHRGRVALAVITWYRMPSGRYDFAGYIA